MTTVRSNLEQNHRVWAHCLHCGHSQQLDLKGLLDRGHGEIELRRLPLRCTECGKKGHRITVSGAHKSGW